MEPKQYVINGSIKLSMTPKGISKGSKQGL